MSTNSNSKISKIEVNNYQELIPQIEFTGSIIKLQNQKKPDQMRLKMGGRQGEVAPCGRFHNLLSSYGIGTAKEEKDQDGNVIKKDRPTYHVSYQINKNDPSFEAVARAYEDRAVQIVAQHSEKLWDGKKLSEEIVREKMHRTIRLPENANSQAKYGASWKFDIYKDIKNLYGADWEDLTFSDLYDESTKRGKGGIHILDYKVPYIWILGKSWGIKYIVSSIKTDPLPEREDTMADLRPPSIRVAENKNKRKAEHDVDPAADVDTSNRNSTDNVSETGNPAEADQHETKRQKMVNENNDNDENESFESSPKRHKILEMNEDQDSVNNAVVTEYIAE